LGAAEASARSAAAEALGNTNIWSERLIEPLAARVHDTEASVQSAAAQALGSLYLLDSNRYDDAITAFKRASVLDRKSPDPHLGLGAGRQCISDSSEY